jgi:hypothetical protein
MGRRRTRFTLAIAMVLALGATSIAYAASRHHSKSVDAHAEVFTAHLNGYNEVPSDNSPATGDLTLTVGNGQLTWSLTYQGFAAGDLNSIIKAMEAGLTYANMHTPTLGAGEIRGQLVRGGHGHGDDDQGGNS